MPNQLTLFIVFYALMNDVESGENVKELKEVSDQGVLCVRGSFGRLNNNVVEVLQSALPFFLFFFFFLNK